MVKRIEPPDDRFRDIGGVLVPRGYGNSDVLPARLSAMIEHFEGGIDTKDGYNHGTPVERNHNGIVQWYQKGTGKDDRVNVAIATGTIANATISPVIFPEIPGIINRQMSQAATSSMSATASSSFAKKIKNAISWFNDSPLGYTAAIQNITFSLRTLNRGVMMALIPIGDPLKWDEYGMKPVKLADGRYWLDVDWAKVGVGKPFLLDVFNFIPTTDPEWPYWYSVKYDNKRTWILLHRSQVVHITKGPSDVPWMGTSSVYICLGFLGEHILVVDERVEKLANMPAEGMLGISGVTQTSEQIKKKLATDAQDRRAKGRLFDKGWSLFTNPSGDPIKFESFSFRARSAESAEFLMRHNEDVLALAFEEPLTSIVMRGGVGYGSQAGVVSENSADGGINSILPVVASALGAMWQRATFLPARVSDATERMKIATLLQLSQAVGHLPEGTLTTPEVRLMIDHVVGIPETDDVESVESTTDNSSDEEDVNADSETKTNDSESKDSEDNKSKMGAVITISNEIDQMIQEAALCF